MKKLFFVLVVALLGAAAVNATTWRINPSPYAKAQFKTVADAMNDINVLSGDTLLLDAGTHDRVDVSARKNMTIIGTGYFLDKNTDWAETQATIISSVTLSEGSDIEGCDVGSLISGKQSHVSRCKVHSLNGAAESLIERCYIDYEMRVSKNSIVRNCIIQPFYSSYPCVRGSDGVIFENNVVYRSYADANIYEGTMSGFTNSTIRNNILINAVAGFDNNQKPYSTYIFYACSNNVVQNNVFSTPATYADATMPHNHFVGATMENTFVNEGSDDAKWQLLPSSAAKGAATHGGDCGAFGGATPYVLSGIPMLLPHITEALVPAKPTDGKITVKLKIQSQNE